jgi:uncharacterized membrane protein YtjA (UPF0391 family)
MFKLAMISLATAAVSGAFAFSGIAAATPGIAEIILSVFLAQLLIVRGGWLPIHRRRQGSLLEKRVAPRVCTL